MISPSGVRILLSAVFGSQVMIGLFRGVYGPMFYIGIGVIVTLLVLSWSYEYEIQREVKRRGNQRR